MLLPACFGSHVSSRSSEADIAPQYLKENIEVFMGGGRGYFVPSTDKDSLRKDNINLLDEAKKQGYEIVFDKDSMQSASSNKLIGVISEKCPHNTRP